MIDLKQRYIDWLTGRRIRKLGAGSKGSDDKRTRAVAALAESGEPAVPQLMDALKSDDAAMSYDAMLALGRIGQPAVEPLIEATLHATPHVRANAAWALGEIREDAGAWALLNGIGDANPQVSEQCEKAITKLGARAIWAIVNGLTYPGREREYANIALSRIDDPAAVPKLLKALAHDHPEVREKSARALARFASDEVIKHLADMHLDPIFSSDEVIRHLADTLLDPVSSVSKAARNSLIEIGEPAADAIIRILPRAAQQPLIHAIQALGEIGGYKAYEALIPQLEHADPKIRAAAAEALAMTKNPEAIDHLAQALKDTEQLVRESAMMSLMSFGPDALKAVCDAYARGAVPYDMAQRLIDVFKRDMGKSVEKGVVNPSQKPPGLGRAVIQPKLAKAGA